MDITLTVVSKDYIEAIAAVLRRSTEPVPKLLVSIYHLHTKTCKYRVQT